MATSSGPGQCPTCGRAFPASGGYCPEDGTRVVSTAPQQHGLQGRVLDNRYEIRESLATNLCRCGTYGRAIRAVQRAAE